MTFNLIALLLLPFITAFIGWLTNWVAIQMLFHPREPRKVFGLTLQGLIPRRQQQLAAEAGEIIERELLSRNVIGNTLRGLDIKPVMEQTARRLIRDRVAARLLTIPLIGGFVNEQTIGMLESMAVQEIRKEADGIIDRLAKDLENHLDIQALVTDRIAAFDLIQLENVVLHVARKEFKTIERLGAVLGFVVGCAQLAILALAGNLSVG
ncbi:MAG: DUF445 domain-containing protein [Opitutales bacterium]